MPLSEKWEPFGRETGRTRHFDSGYHEVTPGWSANLTLPDYGRVSVIQSESEPSHSGCERYALLTSDLVQVSEDPAVRNVQF